MKAVEVEIQTRTGEDKIKAAGGGGGGGGGGGNGQSGSNGEAGEPGFKNDGNPGSNANTTNYSSVSITPGSNYSVSVPSGGTVTISWDAQ